MCIYINVFFLNVKVIFLGFFMVFLFFATCFCWNIITRLASRKLNSFLNSCMSMLHIYIYIHISCTFYNGILVAAEVDIQLL